MDDQIRTPEKMPAMRDYTSDHQGGEDSQNSQSSGYQSGSQPLPLDDMMYGSPGSHSSHSQSSSHSTSQILSSLQLDSDLSNQSWSQGFASSPLESSGARSCSPAFDFVQPLSQPLPRRLSYTESKRVEKQNEQDEFEMLGQIHTQLGEISFPDRLNDVDFEQNSVRHGLIPMNSSEVPSETHSLRNDEQVFDHAEMSMNHGGISDKDLDSRQEDNIFLAHLTLRFSLPQLESHSQPTSFKQPHTASNEQSFSASQPLLQASSLQDPSTGTNLCEMPPDNNTQSIANDQSLPNPFTTSTTVGYGQTVSPGSPSDFDLLGDISPVLPLLTDSPNMPHFTRHNKLQTHNSENPSVGYKAMDDYEENRKSCMTQNNEEEMSGRREEESSFKMPHSARDEVRKILRVFCLFHIRNAVHQYTEEVARIHIKQKEVLVTCRFVNVHRFYRARSHNFTPSTPWFNPS